MASIYPFRAFHPKPNQVKNISSPPYDVISSKEARAMAEGNPKSFLHVIRPEIDLPAGTPFNDKQVYAKGAQNLNNFIKEKLLVQEQEPCLYLYQLEWQGNVQTGLFACVAVDEYDEETIVKHELTRPAKEDDRTKHILTQQAHAEPVMLTYKEEDNIIDLQYNVTEQTEPFFNFEAADGVKHRLWKLPKTKEFQEVFSKVKHFYIADGHHRCKSASRAAHELRDENGSTEEAFNYFPAVIFPSSQMHILAYNRIIHQLPNNFIDVLNEHFDLQSNPSPSPQAKGDISLYLNGNWYGIELPKVDDANAAERLDVYRLQEFLLAPLLDIDDPRRDKNISFVGGSRGTKELKQQVDSGKAALAISMYPTSIEELISISDERLLMPPKSTWFEPKLRSGLLIHKF